MTQGMGHGGLERRSGDEGGELLGFDGPVEKRGLRNGPAGLPPGAVEKLASAFVRSSTQTSQRRNWALII